MTWLTVSLISSSVRDFVHSAGTSAETESMTKKKKVVFLFYLQTKFFDISVEFSQHLFLDLYKSGFTIFYDIYSLG